jgi:hypothetical protein
VLGVYFAEGLGMETEVVSRSFSGGDHDERTLGMRCPFHMVRM